MSQAAVVDDSAYMESLQNQLGHRIAELRRGCGLSQEELAELTSYSTDFIGLVERGVNAPTLARLEDIAKALKVEPWELLKPAELKSSQKSKA